MASSKRVIWLLHTNSQEDECELCRQRTTSLRRPSRLTPIHTLQTVIHLGCVSFLHPSESIDSVCRLTTLLKNKNTRKVE